jgi:perosamine synthetase
MPLSQIKIPVSKPSLTDLEKKYANEAIESSWISSSGKFINQFERDFANECQTRSCILVANGTVALHLSLLALGLKPGDEVIVPSLTYIATANAVRYIGAEPVFVDIDPTTWTIDPKKIESAITPRTKGIIPVHLYGHPADMDAINAIAALHGLWVVEDAAEAPFAKYKGKPTGCLGKVATFSFFGNKILTSGEGGALTLSDPDLEIRARTLRGQGMDPNRRYFFPITGYNYRLTNLASSILLAQLERKDEILNRRNQIYKIYREEMQDFVGIDFQPCASWATISPWLFCVSFNQNLPETARDSLIEFLRNRGIDTRPFFIPVHRLPPFQRESKLRGEVLPVTDNLAACGINLPTYPDMSDADVLEVVDSIRLWRKTI